ncbi:hypothetical protein HDV03_003247 [Kappamyces sp. JEL0829]|nr:hypothetical protein HDV03_003247 [Kappamyces sp. JEL0829]KAJ3360993.1 hypothetical protein HDU91_004177 [Kappamyces sp. JEL0680]
MTSNTQEPGPTALPSYEEALLLLDFPAEKASIKSEIPRSQPITIAPSLAPNSTANPQYPPELYKHEGIEQDELFLAASLLIKGSQEDFTATGVAASPRSKLNGIKKSSGSGVEKKKKKSSGSGSVVPDGERKCDYCAATVTPMWRHGPPGYEDLCNKCGVKWMRGRILSDIAKHGGGRRKE